MICRHMIELDATEASGQIELILQQMHHALQGRDFEKTLDRLVSALGLALQLDPAATALTLIEAVAAAREMARQRDADALSALGPALVSLTHQVSEAGALPRTPVMQAWAVVASDLGALLGTVGLILAMTPGSRSSMMMNASIRADFLDDATGDLFGLGDWLGNLANDLDNDKPATSILS